jgi:hypothetical protein
MRAEHEEMRVAYNDVAAENSDLQDRLIAAEAELR